jgi:deoxyribodipyrimidine photolyase-related protein
MAMKYKSKTTLAGLEGFIRQIIGWREYARFYYYVVPKTIYRKNTFKNSGRMNKTLYMGTTEIPLVNKTIQYAFNYGYINHIQRLMVMSNYMTLWGYHPDMIYKWMYEFSLDSYDWVMIFNCYSMGSWSDGGKAMRKPYISSANYLLKMSNESKGEWSDIWNEKFNRFLTKHKNILKHTQLANLL